MSVLQCLPDANFQIGLSAIQRHCVQMTGNDPTGHLAGGMASQSIGHRPQTVILGHERVLVGGANEPDMGPGYRTKFQLGGHTTPIGLGL